MNRRAERAKDAKAPWDSRLAIFQPARAWLFQHDGFCLALKFNRSRSNALLAVVLSLWGTKNREPLIALEWENSLHNVIAAKATERGALVHAVGDTGDHIHLVASVPPKIALSTFIGQVKGNSSH